VAKSVVVVGGGVAGLSLAFELSERESRVPGGLELRCLEAHEHPGGNIRTAREDGYICEWGPNGFLDNAPKTLELVERLGLTPRLQPADEQAAIRYLYRRGRLRELPTGPRSFLLSKILTIGGRMRLLMEPLARRRPEGVDETVHEFAARRIGPQAARVLVGAMVSGVYAGDAEQLSLRSTFPKMFAMESEHGGLFRAMLAKARAARASGGRSSGGPAGPGGRLTSFVTGLEELIDGLVAALGDAVELGRRVERIERTDGYRVHVSDGAPIDADAVVLACPAWFAAEVVADLDPELSAVMAKIPSAPVAVVHLGYDALAPRPRGFGFLVPRGEGPRILGALWSSNIFPGRSPAGKFLITVMIGGAHDPAALDLDDTGIVQAARTDLATTMGLRGEPSFVRVFRHPRGIPQYTVGHAERLAAIEGHLAQFPGLFVHGNSYRGVSVNLCVEQSPIVADRVVESLRDGSALSAQRRST